MVVMAVVDGRDDGSDLSVNALFLPQCLERLLEEAGGAVFSHPVFVRRFGQSPANTEGNKGTKVNKG